MFKPVDTKQSFPQLEEDILKYWDEQNIFAQSLDRRKKAKKFNFYDGPPFATGLPHYGHVLAMTLKDTVTRYKTMEGYYVPRVNGWDTHGLPVEYELEKELHISGKKEIEEYGVDNFNQKAKEIVLRYSGEWISTMRRMGRWVDFEHAYKTMDNSYIESVWWVFKSLWDKGLIYKDFRVSPYCPRCGTPLSNFEVNQGYREVKDQSVYIKFKAREEDIYFLVWTTTPWTLPANTALAVGRDITYIKAEKDGEVYILAKDKACILGDDPKIVAEFQGSELNSKEYIPLYSLSGEEFIPNQSNYKVYTADFVSTQEGTGIVHIAPAFGDDDMNLGREKGLSVYITVDKEGQVKNSLGLPGEGKFVKQADEDIKNDLKKKGLLYKEELITHTYPMCWRCDSPLLYYPIESWYVAVTKIKDELIENNKHIYWMPKHLKAGRFGKWLEGAKDWVVSRNRFWGAPLPIWQCQNCQEYKAIGSIDELGVGEIDLHKPEIDKITFECQKCKGRMIRVSEVLDCWFESGSMPYAQYHYPFENQDEFMDSFPADFIAEGLDQTRGWFYTLHVLSTALFGKQSFNNVIVNGLVLDESGKKLSKSLRNYVEPETLFAETGVDGLRYFLLASTPIGEDYRFSDKAVRETVRKYILPLWNSYYFLVTYANSDNWTSEKEKLDKFQPKFLLDCWIMARLHQTIANVRQDMGEYDLTRAIRNFNSLITDLSTWYLRRSRKRRDADFYSTLYLLILDLSKLLAPFTPFISESIYLNLTQNGESVHLQDYPKSKPQYINSELLEKMDKVREIVTLGHAFRAERKIKVRQPLARAEVSGLQLDQELIEIIRDELNVKDLDIVEKAREDAVGGRDVSIWLDTEITEELKHEGWARELVRLVQDLRKKAGFSVDDLVKVYFSTDSEDLTRVIAEKKDVLKKETLASDWTKGKVESPDWSGDHLIDQLEIYLAVKK